MRQLAALLSATIVLAAGSPAWGITDESGRGFIFGFGGGLSVPLGNSAERLNSGGDFTAGIGYHFTPHIALYADYMYSWYGLKTRALEGTDFHGDASMQYGDLNALVNFTPQHSRVGVYAIGGPGLYYRRVSINKFEGTAVGAYCDPWLYFCYPTAVPVESVLGSRSTWGFGLNVGAGIDFRLGADTRLYLEGRYHYIWGPTFDTPTGKQSANGQFLPLVVGLRF